MASSTSIPAGAIGKAAPAQTASVAGVRLANIDALRGFVMVLMLLDHLRETWFVNYVVNDPINASTVKPIHPGTNLGETGCPSQGRGVRLGYDCFGRLDH